MRYFLPLYVPLVFFTLASIREVLVHASQIKEAFAAAWIVFSGSALGKARFAPAISGFIGALSFSLNRVLGVVTIIAMNLCAALRGLQETPERLGDLGGICHVRLVVLAACRVLGLERPYRGRRVRE